MQLLVRPAYPGADRGPKILISTASNMALDNLHIRISQLSKADERYEALLPRGSVLRIAEATRVDRAVMSQTLSYQCHHGDNPRPAQLFDTPKSQAQQRFLGTDEQLGTDEHDEAAEAGAAAAKVGKSK